MPFYGERSDVPRLQQVEQKDVGRQRNLGLCQWPSVSSEEKIKMWKQTRQTMDTVWSQKLIPALTKVSFRDRIVRSILIISWFYRSFADARGFALWRLAIPVGQFCAHVNNFFSQQIHWRVCIQQNRLVVVVHLRLFCVWRQFSSLFRRFC